ncbi:hypothetical protein DOT_5255 [Desulfosporosinus sp. OT]|nr:hypothetical protein DOT_5255 [Desulfosporosinus sp. OT]
MPGMGRSKYPNKPTHINRQGEYPTKSKIGKPYPNDMWYYDAPVNEEEDLDKHIQSLWKTFKA